MILGPLSLLPPYSTEVPGTAARAGGRPVASRICSYGAAGSVTSRSPHLLV